MKKIEDLTFTDDYMFGAVMRDPEICKKDWLNTGLAVATFNNICIQNKEIYLNDECTKIFLSANLWKNESDIETQSFLQYLYNYKTTDELTKEIENKVISTKLNEIFRNNYLSMNLHEHDIRLEAKKEGIEETKLSNAKNALLAGISLELVSQICELPLETVKQLAKEAGKCN